MLRFSRGGLGSNSSSILLFSSNFSARAMVADEAEVRLSEACLVASNKSNNQKHGGILFSIEVEAIMQDSMLAKLMRT